MLQNREELKKDFLEIQLKAAEKYLLENEYEDPMISEGPNRELCLAWENEDKTQRFLLEITRTGVIKKWHINTRDQQYRGEH